MAVTNANLAKRLDELEQKTEGIALCHDTFSRNTRAALKQVFDAIRELTTQPEPAKRPIGLVTPTDKGKKPTSSKRKTQKNKGRISGPCSFN